MKKLLNSHTAFLTDRLFDRAGDVLYGTTPAYLRHEIRERVYHVVWDQMISRVFEQLRHKHRKQMRDL